MSGWTARVKVVLFALKFGGFQEITDVIVAVIFVGWELNHKIYTTLMFYETEFRMTCRKRERTMRCTWTYLQETQFA